MESLTLQHKITLVNMFICHIHSTKIANRSIRLKSMKHNLVSSPFWPARSIWQYTCTQCGSKVVGRSAPSVSINNTLVVVGDRFSDIASGDTGVSAECVPWDWSPDWPKKR